MRALEAKYFGPHAAAGGGGGSNSSDDDLAAAAAAAALGAGASADVALLSLDSRRYLQRHNLVAAARDPPGDARAGALLDATRVAQLPRLRAPGSFGSP